MKQKKPVKANPIAKDLRTPKYRSRVVESKKRYSRKSRKLGSAHGDVSRHEVHGLNSGGYNVFL